MHVVLCLPSFGNGIGIDKVTISSVQPEPLGDGLGLEAQR